MALHARGGLAGAALGAEPEVRVRADATGAGPEKEAHTGDTLGGSNHGKEWTYV